MDSERLKSSSPAAIQDEVFFTHESYKKYSCLPSFVEFLDKHLKATKDGGSDIEGSYGNSSITDLPFMSEGYNVQDANRIGAEGDRSNSTPASVGPQMEFPFVSKVSIESQKLLMETLQMIKSRELAKVDLEKMQTVQDLKIKVLTEQEEFQKFVYKHAKANHHLYNYIHPNGWDYFKAKTEEKWMEVNADYPQQYSLQETIGLAVGAVFKSDAVLTFEQTLEQVGNVPLLSLPASNGLLLSEVTSSLKQRLKTPTTETSKFVSEDPVAMDLARKHKVDIVISSSGLNTLLDNHAPDYGKQWQLPVTVQRLEGAQGQSSNQRVVFIDKSLPPQNIDPRLVNWQYFKYALRKLLCTKTGPQNTTVSNGQDRNLGLKTDKTEEDKNDTAEALSEHKTRKRQAVEEENELKELKKPKVAKSTSGPEIYPCEKERDLSITGETRRYFVYNLWRFGKLKILIRCSVDAYRADPEKKNSFTFFSVLPKLEYLPTFGYEKLTPSETARLWLHGYTRPQTKIICGRINVFNSALLRADELSLNDVLQQGTDFNPAQGMKMVFQIFQALMRLPESKFILSHKSGELHSCLYKSFGFSKSSSRSSFEVHTLKTPVMTNFSEATIPWVPIDCNLFLPWQIRKKRVPCTFPAVLEKDLVLMAQKEQEAKAKKSKMNKKKGKKKYKGKAEGFAPKKPKPGHATQQSSDIADQGRKPHNTKSQNRKFHKRWQKGRKSALSANFYDTQPVEKESEVFSAARMASDPVTYDDIDF